MPHYVSLGVTGSNMASVAMFIETCHDISEVGEHKQQVWNNIRSRNLPFGQIRIDDELLVGLIGIDYPAADGDQRDSWKSALLDTGGYVVIHTHQDSGDFHHVTRIVKSIREVSPNPIVIAVDHESMTENAKKDLLDEHFSSEEGVQITYCALTQKASTHAVVKRLLEAIIEKM